MAAEQCLETVLYIVEQPLSQDDLELEMIQQEYQLKSFMKSETPIQRIQILNLECDDDPEAFLMMFECGADDALLPKEEWTTHLAPLLSGEALALYQALPQFITNNYDHVKNAILSHVGKCEETYRTKFRSLSFTEGANPQTVAQKLRDWCRRWLKPETRSPSEIVELIVVEQFIHILPDGAGEWLNHQNVWSLDSAVQLIEIFLSGGDKGPASETNSCSFVQSLVNNEEPLAVQTLVNNVEPLAVQTLVNNVEPLAVQTLVNNDEPFAVQTLVNNDEPLAVQTLANNDDPLVEGVAPEEPVIILSFEEVPTATDFQCSEERVRTEDVSTVFVAVESENLTESEEHVQPLFIDLQGSDENERLEEVQESALQSFQEPDIGEKMESTSAGELKSRSNAEERNYNGYTEKMEHQKTILDQATDIFLQCSEQTTLFNRQKQAQLKQLSPSRNQAKKATECGKRDSKAVNASKQKMYTEERTCLCTHCGNIYTANSVQIDRRKNLSGEKLYTCSECEKAFSPSSDLTPQQQVNIGKNTYRCSECGKGFNRRLHLSIHQRKHTGEKPFTCTECGKSFSQLSNLVRHQQVHSDAKPHVCNKCGKSFRRSSHLIRHEFRHTDREKKFACALCGQRFTLSFNMVSHQRKRICCPQ